MTAKIIAGSSGKGGVGKTTLITNLACTLALGTTTVKKGISRKVEHLKKGRRILVVDMDRQQSAGDALGVRGIQDGTTYGMAIAGNEIDLNDTIYPAGFELGRGSIDVMPTAPYDYELAAASLLNYEDNGLQIVSALLELVKEEYDYILLDLRPELSHFASSAMVAADGGVLVPVTSEATSAVHLAEVHTHLKWLAETTGRNVHPLGVVRSRWEGRSEEARIVDQLLDASDMPVFETPIPAHRVVSKSFVMTTGPVVTSYPKSPATQRFFELTAEIIAAEGGK